MDSYWLVVYKQFGQVMTPQMITLSVKNRSIDLEAPLMPISAGQTKTLFLERLLEVDEVPSSKIWCVLGLLSQVSNKYFF
jgi:hypothetical protein